MGYTIDGVTISSGLVRAPSGLRLTPVSTTAAFYAATTGSFILANATSNTVTVTLPEAITVTGTAFHVMKTDSSANPVVIDPYSTETINGKTTISLLKQYEQATVVSGGTGVWYMFGGSFSMDYLDTSGTPGNATANVPRGRSAVANGSTSCTITNSLVKTSSTVIASPFDTVDDNTSNMRVYKVNQSLGSFKYHILSDAGLARGAMFNWMVIDE